MNKFIYVFCEEARDMLLRKNYVLLKSDNKNKLFVFENKAELSFASIDVEYLFSDTLTF